jgi:nucleotide-binding universal stress UspA family protein
MEIKRILWPTDLSGSARFALDYVRSLTEKYNAEIHVLHVIHDIAHHRGLYGNFDPVHVDKIVSWEYQKGRERLDAICGEELEGCPLYVKHVSVGDPALEILTCIIEQHIDLVVLTAKGSGGYFQFGSVAEKVVKHASVPVIIVPTGGDPVEYNPTLPGPKPSEYRDLPEWHETHL